MTESPKSRRKDERVPTNITVRYGYDSVSSFINAQALNVSRGGMFIKTSDPKPPGTVLGFSLELKDGEKFLKGKGMVCWTTDGREGGKPGMGIRFMELDEDSKILLDLIVATAGERAESPEPPRPAPAKKPTEAEVIPLFSRDSSTGGSNKTGPNRPPLVSMDPPVPLPAPVQAPPPFADPPAPARHEPPAPPPAARILPAPVAPPPPPPAPVAAAPMPVMTLPPVAPPPAIPPFTPPAAQAPRPPSPQPQATPFSAPPPEAPAPTRPAAPRSAAADPELKAAGQALEALRLNRAVECLRNREYARAESELQGLISEAPQNARYRFELGLVYFEWTGKNGRDHDAAAEAAFARAAELDERFDAPLAYLGQVLLRRGLQKEAAAAFHQALSRNAQNRTALDGLAVIQKLEQAGRVRRIAMVAGGAGVLVVTVLIVILVARRPPPEAPVRTEVVYQPAPAPAAPPAPTVAARPQATPAPTAPPPAAAAPAPSAPEPAPSRTAAAPAHAHHAHSRPADSGAHAARGGGGGGGAAKLVKKGEDALRAGQVDEALDDFKLALSANPSFGPAYRGLGSVYVMQGNDAAAAGAYKKYLTLSPNASDAPRIRALLQGMN